MFESLSRHRGNKQCNKQQHRKPSRQKQGEKNNTNVCPGVPCLGDDEKENVSKIGVMSVNRKKKCLF